MVMTFSTENMRGSLDMKKETYKPPFPYFGGKYSVADVVWSALGDVDNYVEPFFGTGAVLFLKPGKPCRIETVNDADGFVSNFWRALRADPDAVADAADWPVNEADLHARHLWLVGQRERITERLMGDPEFYEAQAAGWWVWGISNWIGGGWCSGRGPWSVDESGAMAICNTEAGVHRQRPHLSNANGVQRIRPHLGNAGQGVQRKLQNLRTAGEDEPKTTSERRSLLRSYLKEFSDRLARVRVCCGDWSRICGPSVTYKHGLTGVFLDPPYADTAGRASDIYAVDCKKVAHDVREWAIEEGQNKLMRIVLAGYEDEHDMPDTWYKHEWKAQGGYANQGHSDDSAGKINAKRERLWFSPHCKDPREFTAPLFSEERGNR